MYRQRWASVVAWACARSDPQRADSDPRGPARRVRAPCGAQAAAIPWLGPAALAHATRRARSESSVASRLPGGDVEPAPTDGQLWRLRPPDARRRAGRKRDGRDLSAQRFPPFVSPALSDPRDAAD